MFWMPAYLFLSLLIWDTSADYRNLISCSFESACDLRQNQEDDFDWAEGRGRIRDPGMFAPSGDHTFGDSTGVYFYTPSDETREGQSAKLISDVLPVTINTTVLVDFVYHMYDEEGQDRLGALMVYINEGLIWSKTGNQGPTWRRALVNATCNSNSLQVTFEGTLGGAHSDIGLDDISIGIYEAVIPDVTTEVASESTLDVRPPEAISTDAWRIVACVLLAVVGLMGIGVVVAATYIFRLRKRLSDAKLNGESGSVPSPQSNVEIDPSGYVPLNATIDKKTAETTTDSRTQSSDRYGDMYLQPTTSQQPAVDKVHPEKPEIIFPPSPKLAWNYDEGMDDGVYEYVSTD